jgi:hypothetical protein
MTLSGSWVATHFTPQQSGSFDISSAFVPYRDPTWEFLLDGQGELTLIGGDGILPSGCWPMPSPSATVTEAVLVIDADFPVAVDESTWGRIKALYE